MKYKNPRLRHVKKIKKICEDMRRDFIFNTAVYTEKKTNLILNQCNLLLETKKRKKYNLSKSKKVLLLVAKNDNLYRLFEDNTWDVYRSGELEPSPQPEIEKLDFSKEPNKKFSKFIPSVTDVLIMTKLNEVIDQVNKLTKTK